MAAPQMPLPPGPPPDPALRACPRCGWLTPVAAARCARCGVAYRRGHLAWKIVVGVGLAACLLIGGCVVFLTPPTVSNEQARSIAIGTTRGEVESRLGDGKSAHETGFTGPCLDYGEKGDFTATWRFCFGAPGGGARVVSIDHMKGLS